MNYEESDLGGKYYRKLLECLRMALDDEKLGCHVNNIIIHIARCIESNYTYFDQYHSMWCDYFLRRKGE